MYMYYIFFSHSFVDRHLGCVHVLAVVHCAVMSTGVLVSIELWFYLSVCPGVGLLSWEIGIDICTLFILWLSGKESACSTGDAGPISGSEDSLEKEMAAHSIIFTWEIPWTEERRGL